MGWRSREQRVAQLKQLEPAEQGIGMEGTLQREGFPVVSVGSSHETRAGNWSEQEETTWGSPDGSHRLYVNE